MSRRLHVIGAPTSAGAYAPGQERAPAALRAAGLLDSLRATGLDVVDRGDVAGFRWRNDPASPRAMNAGVVTSVAREVAERVAQSMAEDAAVLVMGGDCTVEVGTIAGASDDGASVGLVYIDFDADLNTPDTTTDGALDWMGVAHLLNLPGTVPSLAQLRGRTPLLAPDHIVLFALGNATRDERRLIREMQIRTVPVATVERDPAAAARGILGGWAQQFERLLVHVDVDVLDYLDLPIAENVRRNRGIRFEALTACLREFAGAPNWRGLTACEINPDHGEADGSTLRIFCRGIARALAPRTGQASESVRP